MEKEGFLHLTCKKFMYYEKKRLFNPGSDYCKFSLCAK